MAHRCCSGPLTHALFIQLFVCSHLTAANVATQRTRLKAVFLVWMCTWRIMRNRLSGRMNYSEIRTFEFSLLWRKRSCVMRSNCLNMFFFYTFIMEKGTMEDGCCWQSRLRKGSFILWSKSRICFENSVAYTLSEKSRPYSDVLDLRQTKLWPKHKYISSKLRIILEHGGGLRGDRVDAQFSQRSLHFNQATVRYWS